MIKNERQYRITAAQADRFERSLEDYSNTPPPGSEIHPRLWEAQREAITNQLAELRTELAEYEALRTGERRVFDVRELKDVSRALIEGRIAVGMTQKDLGSRLKLPEQAIQRYEATDYTSASLERIAEVAAAIGIEPSGLMTLRSATPTRKQFFDRLAEIGLDRRFLLERVLPPTIAAALEIPSRAKDTVSGALLQAAGTIERVFKIKPTALFGNAVLTLDPAIAGATRFKRSKRAGKPIPPEVDGYTVFAHTGVTSMVPVGVPQVAMWSFSNKSRCPRIDGHTTLFMREVT